MSISGHEVERVIQHCPIAQVYASLQDTGLVISNAADAPLLSPVTAAEAAARRLPMPKNMVQAVCVLPQLSGAAGNAAGAADRLAAGQRMVVTVPSRFCGVSVNNAGPFSCAVSPAHLHLLEASATYSTHGIEFGPDMLSCSCLCHCAELFNTMHYRKVVWSGECGRGVSCRAMCAGSARRLADTNSCPARQV